MAGMSRPTSPTCKTRNGPADNEALKHRGAMTIWFDSEMSWNAAPTDRRGRQQNYSDAAIQTCLSMKVLFGMAPNRNGDARPVAPVLLFPVTRFRSHRYPHSGTCRALGMASEP